MKNAKLLIVIPLLILPLVATQGCATVKPIIKTLSDVAYYMCINEKLAEPDKAGFSPEEIGKAFCATDIALKPFLDALLAAKKLKAAGSASAEAPQAPVCPSAAPAPVCPSVAPAAPPAPSVSAAPVKSTEIKATAPRKAAK
jgi:hypothetical protein